MVACPAPATGPPAAGPRLRVLIVDRNADVARSYALLLAVWGHDARVVHTGPDALAVARTFQPDAVCVDPDVRGPDGHQLARRLRQDGDPGPLVLVALAVRDTDRDRQAAREAGFDYYLMKAGDPAALGQLLAPPPVAA